MVIDNRTCWDTRAMRQIIQRVARDELDPGQKLLVGIRYGRQRPPGYESWVGGWAVIGGTEMRLFVPLPRYPFDPVDFAHTVGHEMAHIRGLTHRQMRGCVRWYRIGDWKEHYSWAASMPVGKAGNAKQLHNDPGSHSVDTPCWCGDVGVQTTWSRAVDQADNAKRRGEQIPDGLGSSVRSD